MNSSHGRLAPLCRELCDHKVLPVACAGADLAFRSMVTGCGKRAGCGALQSSFHCAWLPLEIGAAFVDMGSGTKPQLSP